MVKLLFRSACDGLLPLTIGTVTMAEVVHDRIMSVAPFQGKSKVVAKRLGVDLPPANKSADQVIWFGHDTWLVFGDVAHTADAAITDQTDAWAAVQITGTQCHTILARLVPVDLRPTQFAVGDVARTMLGHMSVVIIRRDERCFEIMVMRSTAATLVHELRVTVQSLALQDKNF